MAQALGEIKGAGIALADLTKHYGEVEALIGANLEIEPGEFITLPGAEWIGQDHHLDDDCRLRDPHLRRHLDRRRIDRRHPDLQAESGHGVSALQPVSPHGRLQEHRLSPRDEAHATHRDRIPRAGCPRAGASHRVTRSARQPAQRWATAAHRAREGARFRALGAAPRRAPRRVGSEAATRATARAAATARATRRHHHLRDP